MWEGETGWSFGSGPGRSRLLWLGGAFIIILFIRSARRGELTGGCIYFIPGVNTHVEILGIRSIFPPKSTGAPARLAPRLPNAAALVSITGCLVGGGGGGSKVTRGD